MNYFCDNCIEPFVKLSKFNRHNLEKHRIKPLYICKTENCYYSGPSKRALDNHMIQCDSLLKICSKIGKLKKHFYYF